jgi:hypothetical protein
VKSEVKEVKNLSVHGTEASVESKGTAPFILKFGTTGAKNLSSRLESFILERRNLRSTSKICYQITWT